MGKMPPHKLPATAGRDAGSIEGNSGRLLRLTILEYRAVFEKQQSLARHSNLLRGQHLAGRAARRGRSSGAVDPGAFPST
jgi:hypothetical protein